MSIYGFTVFHAFSFDSGIKVNLKAFSNTINDLDFLILCNTKFFADMSNTSPEIRKQVNFFFHVGFLRVTLGFRPHGLLNWDLSTYFHCDKRDFLIVLPVPPKP